ncbi:MAG: cyclohexadienyl dehydrogenase [Alphaproteobacteria bacterium CG_4_9_14_3_um_filter_47_13]|nr:MAG: cyclohexadienyl dehydrogenase [Alphaproteobacteria bacterium CG_4_9_14_3_um_filter_47_13]
MHNKITIIGFGLIGSSLARNIRKYDLAKEIIVVDRDKNICQRALDLALADYAMIDIRKGVEASDLVILAVPVGACGRIAEQMRYSLKEGAIVTDVGSVKGAVINAVSPHIPACVHFIPAHPVVGTEYSGSEFGFTELFQGRWCIVTPLPETDIRALEKVTSLWESCGAMIEIMEVERHDLILAITSHLPHLLAYTIVGTAYDLEKDTRDDVIRFSASGFHDFTRIAASDPVIWRDIFLNNKYAVLEILKRYYADLEKVKKAIMDDDGDYLEAFFTRARKIRK